MAVDLPDKLVSVSLNYLLMILFLLLLASLESLDICFNDQCVMILGLSLLDLLLVLESHLLIKIGLSLNLFQVLFPLLLVIKCSLLLELLFMQLLILCDVL